MKAKRKPVGWLKRELADRVCKSCKKPYRPLRPLQTCCGYKCALALAAKNANRMAKVQKSKAHQDRRAARERLMTRSDWLKKAQVAVNRWVKLRDKDLPCVSCDATDAKWDAGHYRSRGACPELRFHPDNIHKQCFRCNSILSSNAIDYRIRLIKRIGQERVDFLEGPHPPAKLSIEEIQAVEQKYKKMVKALKEGLQD